MEGDKGRRKIKRQGGKEEEGVCERTLESWREKRE